MRQVDQDLLHASGEGDFERVKWAIEKGADVNANNGQMPLCLASWKGHESIIFLLLEKGADVNAKDDEGSTPLHYASYYGDEAIVSNNHFRSPHFHLLQVVTVGVLSQPLWMIWCQCIWLCFLFMRHPLFRGSQDEDSQQVQLSLHDHLTTEHY
jgi:hypothetical protein